MWGVVEVVATTPPDFFPLHKHAKATDPEHLTNIFYILFGHFHEKNSGVPVKVLVYGVGATLENFKSPFEEFKTSRIQRLPVSRQKFWDTVQKDRENKNR